MNKCVGIRVQEVDNGYLIAFLDDTTSLTGPYDGSIAKQELTVAMDRDNAIEMIADRLRVFFPEVERKPIEPDGFEDDRKLEAMERTIVEGVSRETP